MKSVQIPHTILDSAFIEDNSSSGWRTRIIQNGSIIAVSLAFHSTASYNNEIKDILRFTPKNVPSGFFGHRRIYYPGTPSLEYIIFSSFSSATISIYFGKYTANTEIHENWTYIV